MLIILWYVNMTGADSYELKASVMERVVLPARWAGERHETLKPLSHVARVGPILPNLHMTPLRSWKLLPCTVIIVPPCTDPNAGLIDVIVGVGCAVKESTVLLVLLLDVNVRSSSARLTDTRPDGSTGVMQSISVDERMVADTLAVPKPLSKRHAMPAD
jgi:hypothetical protein